MSIKAPVTFVLVLLTFALIGYAADDKSAQRNTADKHAGLELFKQLAGEWMGKGAEGEHAGQEIHVKYKVTSAGSAVVETMFPDTDHEMVTIIHQDGDDLALTHYCALGNQPHMKTNGKTEGNQIAFKFAGASNMKSDKDMHMHDVTFTFVDKDTLKTEWTNYNNGKPGGKVVFELKRKK
jgi:hypothetical protein